MNETTKIKSFADLIVWQKAHQLVLEIYKVTEGFPRSELFGLSNQMRRAAVSVTSNIAEGFARQSRKEKIHFYSISQGSLVELQDQLIISRDIKYIKDENFKIIIPQTIDVNKLLNGLIRSLRRFP